MLMPASASASNMSAATPGVRLHAGADERDLRDVGVAASRHCRRRLARSPRRHRLGSSGRSAFGSVKEMSVRPSAETFWTIMSMFTPGVRERAEDARGDAGLIGNRRGSSPSPARRHARSRDDRLVHLLASLPIHVPSLSANDERTWSGKSVVASVFDRPERQHLRARGGELEHLLVGDPVRACARRGRRAGRP